MSEKQKPQEEQDLKYNGQNLALVVKEIRQQTSDLKATIAELKASTAELEDKHLILWNMPETLKEELKVLVPEISKTISEQVFAANNNKLKYANVKIEEMISSFEEKLEQSLVQVDGKISSALNKVEQLTKKVEEFEISELAKKLLIGFVAIIVLILCSSGAAYIIHKKFPSNVKITNQGNMHLENNKVLIQNLPSSKTSFKK